METWLDSLPEDLIEALSECSADMVKLLQGANPSQLRAIFAVEGPTQINAVAGSGKTFVLVRRIAYMRYKGIKAGNIFCTTFTKKATTEMTERLEKLVPKMYVSTMTLGTTHSIGYRILKKEYKEMRHHLASAFDPNKDILMNSSQTRYMENIKKAMIKDMSIPFPVKQELAEIAVPQFMKAIGLSKNEGLDHIGYALKHAGTNNNKMLAYIEFYNRYETSKWNDRIIDGDDMLFLLWKLLKENPAILEKYRRIFKYFLVDETQDNNDLQYDIVTMLAYPENNIFVVGDDDQSMYGFRGANPSNFINFTKRFPNATVVSLEDNYRSNPGILHAANSLIRNNSERIRKQLKPNKSSQELSVFHSVYQDENEEAKYVVKEMVQILETTKHQHKHMAVLYRTNAQSRAFEEKLIRAGLPYVIHGGISFYERKEVKDLVAYLKLIENPNDDVAFERIYNTPKRYLGKAFLEKVNKYNGSSWKAINDPKVYDSFTYEKTGVTELKNLINLLRKMKEDGSTTEELLDHIVTGKKANPTAGGYEDFIKEDGDEEDEGNSRMENVNTLKYVVAMYTNIGDFLDYMTEMTTKAKHDINGVQLMTAHKAKGLEFPVSFVVGMSEGIMPHFKSVEDAETGVRPLAVEEERRLAYVAITRPEALCFLSSPKRFNGKPASISRFITEMKEHITVKGVDKDELDKLTDITQYEEEYGDVRIVCSDCHEQYHTVSIPVENIVGDGQIVDGVCPACKDVDNMFTEQMGRMLEQERRELRKITLGD